MTNKFTKFISHRIPQNMAVFITTKTFEKVEKRSDTPHSSKLNKETSRAGALLAICLSLATHGLLALLLYLMSPPSPNIENCTIPISVHLTTMASQKRHPERSPSPAFKFPKRSTTLSTPKQPIIKKRPAIQKVIHADFTTKPKKHSSHGDTFSTRHEKPPLSFQPAPIAQLKRPARPLHTFFPKYPESAIEAEIEGTVILQLNVTRAGLVRNAVVIKGAGFALDQAAKKAVLSYRFEPAVDRKDQKIDSTVEYSILFKLED